MMLGEGRERNASQGPLYPEATLPTLISVCEMAFGAWSAMMPVRPLIPVGCGIDGVLVR